MPLLVEGTEPTEYLSQKIKNELLNCIITDGYKSIKEVIGIDVWIKLLILIVCLK